MAVSRRVVLAALGAGAVAGCSGQGSRSGSTAGAATSSPGPAGAPASPTPGRSAGRQVRTPAPARLPVTRAEIVARYGRRRPRTWGFDAPGVLHALPAGRREIALTFDACGGRGGSAYDQALISVLRRHRVPATLFINSRWIDENPAVFRELAADPLFEIGNHGTRHRPLSVTGRSAYGIPGTRSAGEVFDEVAGNHLKLARLLGAPPRYFRSGTAYCDDVAARIVADLGERVASFSVNGDGGATFTPAQVRATVGAAAPGAVVICHMNHPEGGTAEGIAAAVPLLLGAGRRFVRLP
ncbi:polysaccharide deacetylase family protein [Streptomyces sp. NPDC020917]|uniref:polysaccharide deacetylase family protein n=1 Tax=Streptomyces sp. NPDC020917 TaxID=3365102 RepID=UPI00378EE174